MRFAPIIMFAFNRPEHLARSLESLRANPEARSSSLTIFCDGPRRDADDEAVRQVRAVARAARGFAQVDIVERPQNFGLARSVITGVTDTLAKSDRVIVLEDDLVLSPHFLAYMNDALDLYADDSRVASIHGYCYPVGSELPETFFLRGADCWGWATWRRAWSTFCPDGAALLSELRRSGLTKAFDLDGAYPFTQMLADQVAGRNNSWAVRWHAACFLDEMLTLYPGRSLVTNIGNDASGTHSRSTAEFNADVASRPVRLGGIAVEESGTARAAFSRFLRPKPLQRARRLAKRLLQAGRR